MAFAIALGLYLAAMLARMIIVRHVAVIARRTPTRLDDFAMRVLHATYWPVIAALAVYAGSLTLELPQRVEIIIARVAVISILTQLALWGDKAVRSWRSVYHDQAGKVIGHLEWRRSVWILRPSGTESIWPKGRRRQVLVYAEDVRGNPI
ncbi:hypothetical protein [Massilia sp. TWR1-2-2]|uniref:hypothetical protein n=1 Tax=Massilia sp. TWR1-2-2 TaxID=2804584 RepID=UPI003CF52D83